MVGNPTVVSDDNLGDEYVPIVGDSGVMLDCHVCLWENAGSRAGSHLGGDPETHAQSGGESYSHASAETNPTPVNIGDATSSRNTFGDKSTRSSSGANGDHRA